MVSCWVGDGAAVVVVVAGDVVVGFGVVAVGVVADGVVVGVGAAQPKTARTTLSMTSMLTISPILPFFTHFLLGFMRWLCLQFHSLTHFVLTPLLLILPSGQ